MTYVKSYGLGRAGTVGEADTLLFPPSYNMNDPRMGVLYLHGAAGNAQTINRRDTSPGEYDLVHGIVSAGFPVCAIDAGGAFTWGSAAATAAVEAGRAYLQASGAKAGKVAVCGTSMGGLTCLAYHRDFAANVACALGVIPVIDLEDVYQNDRGAQGFQTSIGGVWGTVAPASLPAGASPAQNVETYAGLKLRVYYSTTDGICLPQLTTAFCDAIGEEHFSVGALGHSQEAVSAVPLGDVIEFLHANEV